MRWRVRGQVFAALLLCAAAGWLVGVWWDSSGPWQRLWGPRPCACTRCLTEGDSCLTELINEAPQPFLSKTLRPSEEEFKWWKALQVSKCNYTSFNATLDKVFQMFPPHPDVVAPGPDRCTTCAVVGNSGILKGSRFGSLIDSHDIVIRMNQGRTKGFEEHVGTRTTHHVLYPESATKLHNTTHLMFFPFKISDIEWLLKTLRPEVRKSGAFANKDLVMILNPAFMKYVHQDWLARNGRYPSTGFMTFVLSLHMCDKVDIFGFGADRDGNWNHYFETLRNKHLRTGPHPGNYEHKLLQKLHNKKKIQIFQGL